MHSITFSDPCFGSYVRIRDDSPGNIGIWCEHLIGPMFLRSLSVESLDNSGKRARRGDSIEKTCRHFHASGSIVGVVSPEPEMSAFRSTIPPVTKKYDYVVDHIPSQCQICLANGDTTHPGMVDDQEDGHVWLEVTESEFRATFLIHIEYHERYIHYDGTIHYKPFGRIVEGSFECDVVHDPRSGSKEYRNPRQLQSAALLNNIIVEEIPNPYGIYEDCLRSVKEHVAIMVDDLVPDPDAEEGRMVKRDEAIYAALDDISLAGINPLSDFSDALAPLEPLKQLIKLLRVRSLLDVFKNLGSLHLMYKYVLKTNLLTFSETKKLIRALRNPSKLLNKIKTFGLEGQGKSKEQFKNGDYDVTVLYNAKLRYICDPKNFDNFLDLVNLLGLTPRITDLWDDLPLSFVLDWVVPIGDLLNNMELNSVQQRVPFDYGILTTKVITAMDREFDLSDRRFRIRLQAVSYKRKVIFEFPRNVWFGISLHDPSRQLLTGGALLLQFMD